MYYFDHSATTPIKSEVLDLITKINKSTYGNASSIYTLGRKAKTIIENARYEVAHSISAKPEQIIFTSGGTEANNQVLWSFLKKSNSHIISNPIEHPAINEVLKYLSTIGLSYSLANVKSDGIISIDSIIKNLKPKTALICLMMANNEIGTIQPLKEIIEIAKERKIMIHTDAVQCIGKTELNVSTLGIDFLSLSAHKFYGPKGIGALYVREPKKINSLILGGGQEKGLRSGTENVALIAGMGLACKMAYNSLAEHKKLLKSLETYFKTQLKTIIPNAVFNGNQLNKIPGLVNVSFIGNKSDLILAKLDRENIAVSNGSACGSGNIKTSPVLTALGLNDEVNLSSIRFSFGASNTKDQIDFLLKQLKLILNKNG